MTRNRTLDEFGFAGAGGPDRSGDGDSAPPEPTAPDVEPIAPTLAWTADGAPCASCEARVDRRWFEDGRLVCESCKDW